jgi:DnaA family protein
MRQLILNLSATALPSLRSFVTGRNEEVIALLSGYDRDETELDKRFVYLWGESSAGKSHLLQAMSSLKNSLYLSAETINADNATLDATSNITLYLLDDCDRLDPDAQIAVFALFNRLRDGGRALIATGSIPPLQLTLREDLRTRLGWGLIYQLHELTDAEKIDALTDAAMERGLTLSPGVIPYLITHFARDMQSLMAMLDALDRYSLETRRPITLPLLRSLLLRESTESA